MIEDGFSNEASPFFFIKPLQLQSFLLCSPRQEEGNSISSQLVPMLKIRSLVPLHVLTPSKLITVLSLFASFIYLLGFFGIDFVQSFISNSNCNMDEDHTIHSSITNSIIPNPECSQTFPKKKMTYSISLSPVKSHPILLNRSLGTASRWPKFGASREALQRQMRRSVEGQPLEEFDYEAILGQCCKMLVRYVQIFVREEAIEVGVFLGGSSQY